MLVYLLFHFFGAVLHIEGSVQQGIRLSLVFGRHRLLEELKAQDSIDCKYSYMYTDFVLDGEARVKTMRGIHFHTGHSEKSSPNEFKVDRHVENLW